MWHLKENLRAHFLPNISQIKSLGGECKNQDSQSKLLITDRIVMQYFMNYIGFYKYLGKNLVHTLSDHR